MQEGYSQRPTIGLLVSGIMDDFTESVCKGVMHEAAEAGANVVVLPGKYLDRDLSMRQEIMYEYQYNTLFSYAGRRNLDAVIVSAGGIGCFTTEDRIREMLSQYDGIPCMLVASKMEGYVSVNYDNDKGIREGLKYLIENRRCQRIGMVGGPDANADAYERRQIYLQILEQYHIPFEDKLYVEGDLTRNSRTECGKLLDDNPDLEAVFCVNDDTALGLYEEMRVRNLCPGRDIYVLGYDNIVAGARSKPTLSTVWADPIELGEQAAKNVLRMLAGEQVDSQILPTRFIKRNSFGEEADSSARTSEWLLDSGSVRDCFEEIFYRYTHEDVVSEIAKVQALFEQSMNRLFEAAHEDSFDERRRGELLESFDNFLNSSMLEYADINNLLHYFRQIYKAIKIEKKDSAGRYALLEIFEEIYRKIIYAMDHRFGIVRQQAEDTSFSMKLFVRDILQFERGSDQSYTVLLDNLDWLGVNNAYAYLFEETITHLSGEGFCPPEMFYLKAVLKNGEAQAVPAVYQRRSLDAIFNYNDVLENPYAMVMLPLFSNESLYGFVLCDLTDNVFREGDFLTNQMSSAVKMIELLKVNEEIQQQLEENLTTLEAHNIVLDNLSKSDVLTGIFNRRGFYEAAEKWLSGQRDGRKTVLVAYVDMNNLKIVNDRYGHEEGDFSLKVIGDTLMEIVKPDGIAGRIGGDEFAFVMLCDREDGGAYVRAQIKERFDSYNRRSPKPYNITVSVGIYMLRAEDTFHLQEALALADESLYEAKSHRVKQVAKKDWTG